jgi:type II secretory pathway pseudopilin PulG
MIRFTAVEAAVAFAVLGSITAIMAPSCLRSVRTSRTAEATENLDRIARAAVTHLNDASKKPLAATPLTPPIVPRGSPAADPPGAWEHPSWQALGFALDDAHWYAYRVEVEDRAVRVVAQGDLDGDGILSTYERKVVREGPTWVLSPALVVTADLE